MKKILYSATLGICISLLFVSGLWAYNNKNDREIRLINMLIKQLNDHWYEGLPACPCDYDTAKSLAKLKNSSQGRWTGGKKISRKYHYGAVYEVRWNPEQYGRSGQQCAYDRGGQLITAGIAAGTPDRVSPMGGISSKAHTREDVRTWETLPCIEYLRKWPTNNGNLCIANKISDIDHMLYLVGNMSCRELTWLIKSADNQLARIPEDLRDFILGREVVLSTQRLKEQLSQWKSTIPFLNRAEHQLVEQLLENLLSVQILAVPGN